MMNNQPFRKKMIIAGLSCGAGLSLLIYMLMYPTHFSAKAQMAHSLGVAPSAYINSQQLYKKAFLHKGQLSDSEFQQALHLLRYHIHQNGWSVRVRAVEAIRGVAGTHNAVAGQNAAQTAISDPNPLIRRQALSTLWYLNKSAGRAAAMKAESDSSASVRRTAYLLLNPLPNQK